MAEEKRETLIRMFPDYDIDTLLASMTNASTEQIADWCLNNPGRVPMKRKGEKRKHAEPAPSPSGEHDSDSDLEFDDIADGLLLDRLVKELLNKLKKEMSLQNNKSIGIVNDAKYVLGAVYPRLRVDFLKVAFIESGYRLLAALIIGFFVSNKLTQRLRDSMPNPESKMWVMTDTLNTTRKRYLLDIFDGDISHYDEAVTIPITTFTTMMNAFTMKYPLILYRLTLLPDAFTIRLDVPDDIEKFDCGVCFCEYTITRRIMCGAGPSTNVEDERHSFCRSCVKQQAKAATEEMPLAEGGIGLKCMAFECKNPILYSAVRNLIPKKVRRKIDERIMEENIGNSGLNLERCRECNFAIEMEESKEENKVFACPNCEKNWCRLCEREWDGDHFGISCAELDDKNKVDKKQRELERRLNEAVIRKCKCGLQFTKSDGCNKMTCRCGKTQCYLCRQEGINYTHFCQHVRNPGVQKCQNCDKTCTLWADANQLDQLTINKIRAENGEAVDPDLPGPSVPRGERQPAPQMDDFNFMQYIRPQMAMFGGFPRPPNRPHFVLPPPIQPPRERHFNAMHDGVNFGFNNGPQGFNLNVNFEPHRYRHVEAVLPQQQLAQRQADQGIVRAVDDVRNRHVREEENLERQLQILRRTEADVRRNFEQLQAFAGQRRDPELRPRRYRMIEDDEQRQERERRRRERMQNVGRLVPNEDGVGRNIDQIGENLYNRARDADLVVPRPLRERHVTFAEPQIAPNQREYRQPSHRERHVALAGVAEAVEQPPLWMRNISVRDELPRTRQQTARERQVAAGEHGTADNQIEDPQPPRLEQPAAFANPRFIVPKVEDQPQPGLRNVANQRVNEQPARERRVAFMEGQMIPHRREARQFYQHRERRPALPELENAQRQTAQNAEPNRNANIENNGQMRVRHIPPEERQCNIHQPRRAPEIAGNEREPPRFARATINLQQAQNYGPIGANVNLNNQIPRIMNINIGQNNMVHFQHVQNPLERVEIRVGHQNAQPIIHDPIIGDPLNVQNNMEEPALNIEQNAFEQPAFEFEGHFSDADDDMEVADSIITSDSSSNNEDDDDIALALELIADDEQRIDVLEPPPPPHEEPQQQQPNELIDLTELEDDAAVVETDLKHIERIHDKGERFEVMPIDLNSHIREVKQLDKDWTFIYQLIDDLKTSNEKMRESVNINDTGREPDKSQAILGTLDLHDEIANFIMQKMPQLNAQTEKLNNL